MDKLLMYYKENIDQLNAKNNINIKFEQDGARAHTSRANINLMNQLFGQENWLQNPPNSPDLAYPIETLWGIIKPRIKRRNPQTIEELKEITKEEWNSIPDNLIKNLCKNFILRIKKVKELEGARLEPEHLRKLGTKKSEEYNWNNQSEFKVAKCVYNDEKLLKIKKKEILFLKKKIKETRSVYREKIRNCKKIKKRELYGRSLGYAKAMLSLPEKREKERDDKINELKSKIEAISKMDMIKYLRHIQELKKKRKKRMQIRMRRIVNPLLTKQLKKY